MFDEFGPRGAEDEREGFWTDLSEVPDEQYRDEDEPKQTQEVIVPPAQEPYGPGIVPPEEIVGQRGAKRGQRRHQRGVVPCRQERAAGADHGLAVAGVGGVLLLHRQ